jgi:4,5-DOPA dioxygenase extradiol
MGVRAPTVFISHGAPTVAVEESDYTAALAALGRSLDTPAALLVLSAHWQRDPLGVTAAKHPETIHDFGGFPDELYRIGYPAPGAPALATRIAELVGASLDRERGLDHGVWVPLRHVVPDAGVPVVQLSLPRRPEPDRLVALGRALAPLREEGVVLVGSGGIVHNLAQLAPGAERVPDWAATFDRWVAERVARLDLAELAGYRRAPYASLAVPTSEHFAPVLVVLGAALPGDRVETIFEGFQLGTLSLQSFALRG